jgi:hypothetical protein
MCSGMTRSAKGYEVLLGVVAGMTAELCVVDLQIRRGAAPLTPPAVAAKHLFPKISIRYVIQP